MLPIGQQLWMEHLMTYEKFPPLQNPESYNLSGILAEMKKDHRGHRGLEGMASGHFSTTCPLALHGDRDAHQRTELMPRVVSVRDLEWHVAARILDPVRESHRVLGGHSNATV
jgi:hypothetical protein